MSEAYDMNQPIETHERRNRSASNEMGCPKSSNDKGQWHLRVAAKLVVVVVRGDPTTYQLKKADKELLTLP